MTIYNSDQNGRMEKQEMENENGDMENGNFIARKTSLNFREKADSRHTHP